MKNHKYLMMSEKQIHHERLTIICEKGKVSFQNNFTVFSIKEPALIARDRL